MLFIGLTFIIFGCLVQFFGFAVGVAALIVGLSLVVIAIMLGDRPSALR